MTAAVNAGTAGARAGVTDEPLYVTPAVRAIAALGAGRPILLIDPDGGRAYAVAAAERVTEEFLALSAARGRGVLKAAMSPERVQELGIPAISDTGCHAPVDLVGCDRSGVPADRVATFRALADPSLSAGALLVPGQVFPIPFAECDSFDEPCLSRLMTEAAALAGCAPVAAYCELDPAGDGAAGGAAADRMSRRLGVPVVGVRELLIHRERVAPSLSRVVETSIPTGEGVLRALGFVGERSAESYAVFVSGDISGACRVHIHRRCRDGDVFGSLTCACGEHLRRAQHEIHAEPGGVIVYCDLDGAGGACPAADDERMPSLGFTAEVAAVLRDLGLRQVRLSSNVLIDAGDLADLGIDANPATGETASADRAVA